MKLLDFLNAGLDCCYHQDNCCSRATYYSIPEGPGQTNLQIMQQLNPWYCILVHRYPEEANFALAAGLLTNVSPNFVCLIKTEKGRAFHRQLRGDYS